MEYTAKLNGYRSFCYDPKAISNLLFLYLATRKYRVVFNRKGGNCFSIMLSGREVFFNVSTNRLYFHDTVDLAIVLTNMVA